MLIRTVRKLVTSTADAVAGASATVVTSLPGSDEAKMRRVVPIIAVRRVVDLPLKLL
ncbi:hypothetical protein [Pseudonocardia sp. WMMC193]|uniref:hypothetical protein n=1 Tax=Pseudonocardia sp. WMMC193 TaxID=2911965 RepID=UPI001F48FAB5|nr:hypothetical protein [Pseudonocardia sp. WMMC193]MCF7550741.1 hypothetical protein [Pseudonocardia sp. WMMC193]